MELQRQSGCVNTPHETTLEYDEKELRLLASEIQARVARELKVVYYVGSLPQFMQKIMPVPSELNLNAVFTHLKDLGLYSENAWKNLPNEKTGKKMKEEEMYKPIVEIANSINKFVIELKRGGEGEKSEGHVTGRWVDCVAVSPASLKATKSMVRPNCAFISIQSDVNILEEMHEYLLRSPIMTRSRTRMQQRRTSQEQGAEKPQTMATDRRSRQKDVDMLETGIYWLQLFNAVEVKKDSSPESISQARLQLCCYVREIFRHQADRRFVIGLTLCGSQMTVYLFDRSGVLGTPQFNIHEAPLQLVQTIIAFSLLSPEQLGWDPTMQILHKNRCHSSFRFPWSEVKEGFNPQWVVDHHGEKYVVLRCLSKIDLQMMCGRATVVWEVSRLLEFEKKTPEKIFVLKQSWQRIPGETTKYAELETRPLEGLVAQRYTSGKRSIKAAYVRGYNSQVVSTLVAIRGYLVANSRAVLTGETKIKRSPSKTTDKSRTKNTSERREHSNLFSHSSRAVDIRELHPDSKHPRSVVNRKQTRVLMTTRGWPMKYFKSRRELLVVMLNAIERHQEMYYKGLLHRDISPNNIIVLHDSQQTEQEKGDLIDFDHLKITKSFRTWQESKNLEGPEEVDRQFMLGTQSVLKRREIPLALDTLEQAARVLSSDKMTRYFPAILDRFSSRFMGNEEYNLKDLGLEEPAAYYPAFDVGPGQRTGTPAYMSHAILSTIPAVHDAVHDMESFFWIMVETALICDGPGNSGRDLRSKKLSNILENYFYDSTMAASKKSSLFPNSPYTAALLSLEQDLIGQFHPYFEPFKTLIRDWWKTLYTAYEFEAFELANIHTHISDLLRSCLEELTRVESNTDQLTEKEKEFRKQWDQFTKREEERRQKWEVAIRDAFENQCMVKPAIPAEDIPKLPEDIPDLATEDVPEDIIDLATGEIPQFIPDPPREDVLNLPIECEEDKPPPKKIRRLA